MTVQETNILKLLDDHLWTEIDAAVARAQEHRAKAAELDAYVARLRDIAAAGDIVRVPDARPMSHG